MNRLPEQPPGWITPYIGLHFEEHGRSREGVDCYGLVRLFYAERMGILLPSLTERYAGMEDVEGMDETVGKVTGANGHWRALDRSGEARFGDVALFRVAGVRSHVGIVVARESFLHCLRGVESCLERFDSPNWSNRLIGFYRYAGPVLIRGHVAPFLTPIHQAEIPEGGNIEDMLRASGVRPSPFLRVWLGDIEVPPDKWVRVRPKAGRRLTVSAVPEGGGGQGGGKTAARIILSIAVIAAAIAAPYLAPASLGLVTATGTVSLAGALVSAGVGIVGTLAVNSLIPPPRPRVSSDSGQSPTITGARNEIRQYGRQPVVLGRHRIAPLYGAMPFTEIVDDAQYLRLLFNCGYGPLDLSELKIGDTPLDEFEGVEYEIRPGRDDDAPLQIYSNTVLEDQLSILLKQVDSWTTRTSNTDADELSIDTTFPQGLVRLASDGSRENVTVTTEVEYSPAGANAWIPVNNGSPEHGRAMDYMFRTPEVALGGTGTFTADLAWGLGFAGAKPSYLPSTGYSWEASGWFYAPFRGLYTFALDASDAAEIAVNGRVVVGFYGQHSTIGAGTPDFTANQGTVFIFRPGWNQLRIRMESRSNTGAIAVGWKPPATGSIVVLPTASLSREARSTTTPGLNVRWFNTAGYSAPIITTSNRAAQIRRSISWAVPRGQYDVRIRRTTADSTNTNVVDQVYWTALRTIRNEDPITLPGVAKIAIRIRATDQLNGVIDTFNCVAHSILPDWDPDVGEWIERATSSPAACYRAVMQGPANKRPVADSRLDLSTLQTWAVEARDRGLEFNGVYDTPGTVYERVSDVCAAGRASFGMRDGLYSVVRDYVRSVPVQHFTPANSRDFSGHKVFTNVPHALRVRFLDSAIGYQQNEKIVLADGYQLNGRDAFNNPAPSLPAATLFDTIEFFGTVTWAEAFKHARYHQAAAKLRPETFEISTDFEHLVCTRGDLVLVTHDVPQWGLNFGRIIALVTDADDNLVGLDLDNEITMDAGDTYTIRVRLEDATSFTVGITAIEGISQRVMFSSPVGPDTIRPKAGDLFMFGRTGQESRELVVKGIEIDSDLGARLTLVDHAPAIHLADQGTVPPYDPGISQPPRYEDGPETPVIESIRSDDFVMIRDSDGSLRPRMLITLRRQGGTRPLANSAQTRTRPRPVPPAEPVGPWDVHPLAPIDNNQVSVENVEEGTTYDIMLRTITAVGQASAWVTAQHTVLGKMNPPPDVQAFDVVRLSDGTRRYSWDLGDVPPDIAGVMLRYGPVDSLWEAMTPLHQNPIQSSPAELNEPPAGTWRFGIRAIDTSGNMSANPLYIERELSQPRLEGVAFSQDAGIDDWPGTRTSCHITSENTLEADDTATWDTLASLGVSTWAAWNRWILLPASPIRYESPALDSEILFGFNPDAIATGEGVISVELSWSVDNVAWSAWTPVETARGMTVIARSLRARVTCHASADFPVPVIRSLLVMMRAPTVIHEIQDLETVDFTDTPGDLRLPVPLGLFALVRIVSISFNGMGAGWSWDLIDRDPVRGPHVRIYNGDHVLSDATVDVVVRGIGLATLGSGTALDFSDPNNSAWIGAI